MENKLKRLKKTLHHKYKKNLRVAIVLGITSSIFLPAVVHADEPSAKPFVNSLLSDWVAPFFALIVVFLVIKAFQKQEWIQGGITLIVGGLIFLFIRDPESFLDTVSSIPKKFGF